MVGTSQARWYSPTEPRGGARGIRPDREEPQVVVVVAGAGAHEDGAAAEGVLDDLEAEDASVERRRRGRVADIQDGVVESRRPGCSRAQSARRRGAFQRFRSRGDRGRLGRADELPARLPGPAVDDVEGDVQEGEALELARPDERPDIDRVEPDRARRARAPRPWRRRRRRRRTRRAGRRSVMGSAWFDAKSVLNALTTFASGQQRGERPRHSRRWCRSRARPRRRRCGW